MKTRRESILTLAAMGLTSVPCTGLAQAKWPSKPISMVCGFAAGSATDIVARVVGQKLSERLGEPVVVQNITGAASTIASENVSRAAPDGYTLMTVSGAVTISPAVYDNLRFDVERDFTAIVSIGFLPTALMVNDQLPVKTFKEFVDYAKKHPGTLNYGSSGTGGSTHMSAALLSQAVGIQITHVPYRGNGPASQALMAGEVQVLMDTALLAAQTIKTKRVRALAVTGKERSSALPDVPTFAEAGLADFDASVLFGIMGPKGLPREVVERVNRETNEVLKDPGVQTQLMKTGGLQLTGGTQESFAKLLSSEIAKWKKLAGQMNIRADK